MAELAPEQRASYAAIIDDILSSSDINSVSAKAVRKGMQERIAYDITPQKAAITTLILERFDKFMPAAPASAPAPTTNGHSDDPARKRKAEGAGNSSELSDVDSEPAPKKVKRSKSKPEADSDEAFAAKLQAQFNAQARSTRGGGVVKKKNPVKREKKPKKKSAAKIGSDLDSDVEGGASDATKERKGGFHKLMNLSAPLAELVGEPALSRPQTVKKIWEYVKARDLQDPADKRQIRCDEKLQAVFKSDRVHMFTMNKILATHLYPVEE